MSFFDTNILIDALKGIPAAIAEIRVYENPLVSIITQMEVLVGAPTEAHEKAARGLLSLFEVVSINKETADLAVKIRKETKLKLLDAIILASAQSRKTFLITRNSKDFPEGTPYVRIPYKI